MPHRSRNQSTTPIMQSMATSYWHCMFHRRWQSAGSRYAFIDRDAQGKMLRLLGSHTCKDRGHGYATLITEDHNQHKTVRTFHQDKKPLPSQGNRLRSYASSWLPKPPKPPKSCGLSTAVLSSGRSSVLVPFIIGHTISADGGRESRSEVRGLVRTSCAGNATKAFSPSARLTQSKGPRGLPLGHKTQLCFAQRRQGKRHRMPEAESSSYSRVSAWQLTGVVLAGDLHSRPPRPTVSFEPGWAPMTGCVELAVSTGLVEASQQRVD